MRSTTRTSIRSASCVGALVLASGSWFGAGTALADQNGGPTPSGTEAAAPAKAQPTSTQTTQSKEQADGCDHGATGKDCKPDPRPTNGKDCKEHGNTGGVNEDHCGPATKPSKPAEPTTPAETSKPADPTKPAEPTATAEPSKPVETPKPADPTPSATPEPTKGAELVEVEVWWILPEGADPNNPWVYTQTRIPVNSEIPCGRVVQTDLYRGTQEQIDALGDTLEPGEDYAIVVDSHIIVGDECETPAPTPEPSETPAPTPEPSETPAPTPEPSDTPAPSETPAPSQTPAPTPEPSDLPLPNEPSTPATQTEKPAPTPEVTTPEVTTPAEQTPEDLPLVETPEEEPAEETSTERPAGLPHTGDQGDGFSPLAAGAGICGIVFLSTFVGRKKD